MNKILRTQDRHCQCCGSDNLENSKSWIKANAEMNL
jgi:hypothetical protein